MHSDEIVIYEPLENSNLISIIPEDDKILYSAIFEVFNRFKLKDKWSSHVILTDKGVAILSSGFISIPNGCGVKLGDFYYFPWHAVQRSHSTRLAIGNYHLRLEANKDLEAIKPIDVMDKELMERSEILINQSKDELYEKLLPIITSYPKAFLPLNNSPRFSMLSKVYIELRVRYNKEVEKGIFKYRSKVKPISKKTYYSKERIIEEIRNYNCEPGTYEELMKEGEMAVVFANFFVKHSVEEAVNLILELFEINPIFVNNWYSIVHNIIVNRFPRKEKDLYEFENIIAEQIHFKLLFKADEYVIVDFKGTVKLPKAHLKYFGHIYITNYRLIFKAFRKTKIIFMGGAVESIIRAGVEAHIINAREELDRVMAQNTDMFHIRNPYNIKLTLINIQFTMNYNYIDELQKSKVYKFVISINLQQFFNQKREEGVSKLADFFSKFPNTVCPNCSNVQEKSLKKCEKCGKKMKVAF